MHPDKIIKGIKGAAVAIVGLDESPNLASREPKLQNLVEY